MSRIQDLGMWAILNAGERDMEQWEALFRRADPRLKLVHVEKPAGSALSVMDLELGGEHDTG